MMPLIDVEGVSQVFNRHCPDEVQALRDVSLQLHSGKCLALTGPSGSGKTSLLSLLGCMSRPTSGRIHFNGRAVSRLPERFLARIRRESFGFIFQQFNLLRDLSVVENIQIPLYTARLSAAALRARVDETLHRLDLQHRSTMKVKQLSGGEPQRVPIARALINRPTLLIADEPTAHLDRRLPQELFTIFTGLKDEGTTLVIATHDPFVMQHPLIDRRIALHDGAIVENLRP